MQREGFVIMERRIMLVGAALPKSISLSTDADMSVLMWKAEGNGVARMEGGSLARHHQRSPAMVVQPVNWRASLDQSKNLAIQVAESVDGCDVITADGYSLRLHCLWQRHGAVASRVSHRCPDIPGPFRSTVRGRTKQGTDCTDWPQARNQRRGEIGDSYKLSAFHFISFGCVWLAHTDAVIFPT
eukprot:1214121-Rhodomonas_salina.1